MTAAPPSPAPGAALQSQLRLTPVATAAGYGLSLVATGQAPLSLARSVGFERRSADGTFEPVPGAGLELRTRCAEGPPSAPCVTLSLGGELLAPAGLERAAASADCGAPLRVRPGEVGRFVVARCDGSGSARSPLVYGH